MTTLCGGGTSAPKASTPLIVKITTALLLAKLGGYGSVASWISNILSFLGLPDVDTSTFCATDPPAIPTFDANDALAIASLPVGSAQFAITAQKVSDLMLHLLWYDLCECTSGSLTALPAPATPPSGAGSPVGLPPTGPCLTLTNSPVSRPSGGSLNWQPRTAFPIGCTSIEGIVTIVQVAGGAHPNFRDAMRFYDIFGAQLNVSSVGFFGINPGTQTTTYTRPVQAEFFDIDHFFAGASSNDTIQSVFNFYCGSAAPAGTPSGCCPPDDVTLGLLQQLITMVTLMQRQSVPFAYVPGATHSGLSGSGHIDVQGLIGAKITATVPGRAGIDFGDPDTVYEIGHINWGNADGYGPKEQLVTSPQLSFPNLAGNYTRIGYTIPADVSVTILELVREP